MNYPGQVIFGLLGGCLTRAGLVGTPGEAICSTGELDEGGANDRALPGLPSTGPWPVDLHPALTATSPPPWSFLAFGDGN